MFLVAAKILQKIIEMLLNVAERLLNLNESFCVGNFTECCRNLPNLTRTGLIASSAPDIHHFLARPYFPSSWLSFHFSVSASSFARPAADDRLLLDRDVAILRRQLEDLVLLHLHARWQQRDQRTNLESK